MPLDHWELWTIYNNPRDFPARFVARQSLWNGKSFDMTAGIIISESLEAVRDSLMCKGLTCLPRDPNDDPVIVEVWL